jgi:hypothetical protein
VGKVCQPKTTVVVVAALTLEATVTRAPSLVAEMLGYSYHIT